MTVSPSSHPRYPWRVKWREGTVQKNRFFPSERAARDFARRKAPQLRDVAPSDAPPTKEERRALDEARAHGVPLLAAITHWRQTVGASSAMTFAEFAAARLKEAQKFGLALPV